MSTTSKQTGRTVPPPVIQRLMGQGSAKRKLADAGKEWANISCSLRDIELPQQALDGDEKAKFWTTLVANVANHRLKLGDSKFTLPDKEPTWWKDVIGAVQDLVQGHIARMVDGELYIPS
ncbi:hypothetical protein QFC22_006602 [Naganishia vaughanmartiniae]|uniref:Uncharacterized protein n=1 Tax=Naganishia vaughanmartiniae TaxID=1424756 RepID=A0ACC2WKZ6_9TREE|nr:hypothetical protein QFC22_006602 [Naganishia vaughanmartiniae]